MSDGGSSSSSSSNSNVTSNTTSSWSSHADNRVVADGGGTTLANSSGNVVNVQAIDSGAIAGAFGFGKDALDMSKAGMEINARSFEDVLGLAGDVFDMTRESSRLVADSLQAGNQQISRAYENAEEMSNGSRWLVAGGLLVVGIVAVSVMGARR